MPRILFYCILFFLFPSPVLFSPRHHCERAHVLAPMIYSGATSALPSPLTVSGSQYFIWNSLPLFLGKAACFVRSSRGCKDVIAAALLCRSEVLSQFSGCFWVPPSPRSLQQPVSSVTERVTNPGWHCVPCQCHHPRSVPAIHPRAASRGDSRSAAAGCSHPSLSLEWSGFRLVATPPRALAPLFWLKKLSVPELKKWPFSGWAQGVEGRFSLFLH